MSEEKDYSVGIVRRQLERHLTEAQAAQAPSWMLEAISLLVQEAAVVPAPAKRSDAIPTYIYPH